MSNDSVWFKSIWMCCEHNIVASKPTHVIRSRQIVMDGRDVILYFSLSSHKSLSSYRSSKVTFLFVRSALSHTAAKVLLKGRSTLSKKYCEWVYEMISWQWYHRRGHRYIHAFFLFFLSVTTEEWIIERQDLQSQDFWPHWIFRPLRLFRGNVTNIWWKNIQEGRVFEPLHCWLQ